MIVLTKATKPTSELLKCKSSMMTGITKLIESRLKKVKPQVKKNRITIALS
ncbi:hypothetical protein D3C73_1615900 [compost metagenome]